MRFPCFHAEDFRIAFPNQPLSIRDDFLIDNGRITVPGGISILSLMTELIRSHCGPDRAAKAVHQLSLTEQRSMSAFNQQRASSFRDAGDIRIQRAIVLIESRKGRDVSPEMAAEMARLFQEHIGMTPKRFILEARLRYARFLLENSLIPITEIAFETGFSDSAHLATAFKSKYGCSPRSLRKT